MDEISGDLFYFAFIASAWVALILFRCFHHHQVSLTDIETGPHQWGRYEDETVVGAFNGQSEAPKTLSKTTTL